MSEDWAGVMGITFLALLLAIAYWFENRNDAYRVKCDKDLDVLRVSYANAVARIEEQYAARAREIASASPPPEPPKPKVALTPGDRSLEL